MEDGTIFRLQTPNTTYLMGVIHGCCLGHLYYGKRMEDYRARERHIVCQPLAPGKHTVAMVRGIQSQNISACVKHFCCNNKETNRDASDSRISELALREIYLKAFRIVIAEGKVWSVMTSYNLLNGTYTSENKDLLTGILREEWHFDGLIITDWVNLAEHYWKVLAGNNLRIPQGKGIGPDYAGRSSGQRTENSGIPAQIGVNNTRSLGKFSPGTPLEPL